ncbi:MAG: hypothetical protein EVA89_10790 [Sandaracinaceae bacterium]|nr:MAG: hypothetical protein EVA89_10790 [Sandaracinaceae bacterium]
MSDGDKLQRQFDALVIGFVAPLVTGGMVTVDRPLAPGAITYFEHATSTDSLADHEIYDQLHRHASSLAPIRNVPWPDRDLILLAMASYDLVLITDPKLDRLFARGHRERIADWVAEIIEAVAPPNTRADALARHALLDPLPALRRKDVVAKSWAYTYRFIGRPTNSGLLTRPVMGDFRKQENLIDVEALWAKVDAEAGLATLSRLRQLLSRSPVTELLRLDLCERFRFGLATLAVLSDDAIRGGIAREIVARGEWKAAPRLGRALGDPILQHAPPAHLYYALALCFESQMTATLDVPGPGLPDHLDLSDRDVARYAAVLPAFFDDETMLDEVRAFDDDDRGVVQERCARLASALPPGVLDEVAPLVRRCQRPAPRSSAPLPEVRP